MPDTQVQAEHRPREQSRIGLRKLPLLHPADQERRPRELEVAGAGPGELACLLLPRRAAPDADEALLGHEHPNAQHLVLGQLVARSQEREQRLQVVLVLARDPLEVALERLQRRPS